jgi:N-acetylmuramoyl-L-alanine amidase
MPAEAWSIGPVAGGDLPKDRRQAANRWRRRNMRRGNAHRLATNLCTLTIVNAAMGDNPNIRCRQVRTNTLMRLCSKGRGHSMMQPPVATRRPAWPRRCLFLARRAVVALAAAGLAASAAPAAAASVNDIRVATHGDATRIVIDLSGPVSFRQITLAKPPRLAIDLPEVDWTVGDDEVERAVGMVKGYRFGQPRSGVSRIVVDVAQPFEIKQVFELPPSGHRGYRIVTDLVETPVDVRHGHAVNGTVAPAAGSAAPRSTALMIPLPPERKPPPPSARRVIVLDPGHGGVDPGAIGRTSRVFEKDIALRMGLELRDQLEETGRYEVIMTRDDDRIVRLRDRLRIARESQAELFVSLHADSLVKAPKINGASVYTLSERASNKEAERLASKENRADILAGIDLSDQGDIVTEILIDLAQRDANNKSIKVAELLVEEFRGATNMARRQRAQAGFVVLKSPDMPSVLIELGYLSNPGDEKALADPAHIARLAAAVVRAIDRQFGLAPS